MSMSKESQDLIKQWRNTANTLVEQLEKESDRDLLLHSNIVNLPEREQTTARTLLNIRLSEKQQDLMNDLKIAISDFNRSSTRISIAMYILALATCVIAIRSWLNF